MAERAGTSDRLTPIARHLSAVEADLIRCHLEAANIPAFVDNAAIVAMDWALSNAIGGVQVLVRASDADAALALLERRGRPELPPLAELDADDEHEDYGDSTAEHPDERMVEAPPNEREALADRAFRAALLSVWLVPLVVYAVWLLLKVANFDEEMRPVYRRRAWVAAAVLLAPVLVICLMIVVALRPPFLGP